MKPTKAQREWAMRTIEKWRPRLFLQEWTIEIEYPKEDPENQALADCTSSATYSDAVIRIYPKFWSHPQNRREHILIHELCHCVTSRVCFMLSDLLRGYLHSENQIDFHIEQLTQRIANIAYWGK